MNRTDDERFASKTIESETNVEISGDVSGPEATNPSRLASDEKNDSSTIDTIRAALPMISLYEPDPIEDQLVGDHDTQFTDTSKQEFNASNLSNDTNSEQAESSGTQLKGLPALAAYQKSYATSLGNNDAKAIKLFKEFESEDKIRRIKSELLAISQGRAAEELCLRILGPVRRSKFGSFAAWAKFALGYVNSAAR